MEKQKIVFFMQTHKPIGGSQVLFLNLAKYISTHYKQYQCYYINYRNPNVEEIYGNKNIVFQDVEKCDYSKLEDAVFFTPVNYVFYLLNKIKKVRNARICLYFYHPQIFDWLGMQISKKVVNFEPFLNIINKHNGCCFMDSSNFFAANRLSNVDFKEDYVPVTLSDTLMDYVPLSKASEDRIRIGWLGRLDGDKIYSVLNTIENLFSMGGGVKLIDFHIIGDGNAKSYIKFMNYTPQIRFIFTSYLYGEERNKYVRDNIDIMIAMGMSAIDVAVLGVPTVLPIVSPIKFNDDKYIFLYDTTGYSLGWDVKDIRDSKCKYYTLEKVIAKTYKQDSKVKLGLKCRKFALSKFSLKNGAISLLNVVNNTTLTVEECFKCKLIRSQIRKSAIYAKLRKRKDFESFHEFNARIKRIHLEKGIVQKLKRIKFELRKTFKKGK